MPPNTNNVRLNFISLVGIGKMKANIGDKPYENIVKTYLKRSKEVVKRARELKRKGWNHGCALFRYKLVKYFNAIKL